MVDRARAGPGADVQKDANVWLENRSKGIEEPAMRVDLLLILLFETEDNLHRYDSLLGALDLIRLGERDFFFSRFKIRLEYEIRERTLRGVLVYMRGNRFAVDDVGSDAVLICAYGRNGAQGARVDLLAPVADDTNDDFLPTVLSPSLAAFAFTEISDVLHDAVHGTREQRVVLIVHRHDDEELRPAGRVVVYLAQCESVVLEIVRIARRSRIAHMCELPLVFECA